MGVPVAGDRRGPAPGPAEHRGLAGRGCGGPGQGRVPGATGESQRWSRVIQLPKNQGDRMPGATGMASVLLQLNRLPRASTGTVRCVSWLV
jgi:hypothetical protein